MAARKVTSEIADVLHGTKELKRLPSSADDYSQDQIASLTDTYQAYAALSEEEQKAVQESPRFPEERLTDFVEPDGFFVLSFPVPEPEPLPEDAPAFSFCSSFSAFSSTR